MKNNNTGKIEKIDERIQQLLNEKKKLLNQDKEAERKARTKRLIENGAILESVISDIKEFNGDQVKRFLVKTIKTEFARRAFNEAKDWKPAEQKPVNQPKITVEAEDEPE